MTNYPVSPREAARRFTPELTALVNNPLHSDVWTDGRLSPRDRIIATLAALTVLYRPEETKSPRSSRTSRSTAGFRPRSRRR